MRKLLFVFGGLLVSAAFAAEPSGVVSVWTPATPGYTPLTAGDYFSAANWKGNSVPQSKDSVAVFVPNGDGYEYIRAAGDLTIGSFANDTTRKLYLVFDHLTVDASTGFTLTPANCEAITGVKLTSNLAAGRLRTDANYNRIYADKIVSKGTLSGKYELAAPVSMPDGMSITIGVVSHDMRFYATNANPVRVNEYDISGGKLLQGSIFRMSSPKPCAATSGTYQLTEGKPYAQWFSGAKGLKLSPGAVLTDGPFPTGTFLKRVFDDNWIELSAVPTKPGTATLAFAAYQPVVTNHVCAWTYPLENWGMGVYLSKYESDQESVLVIDKLSSNTGAGGVTFRAAGAAYYPMTCVIGDSSDWHKGVLLENADLVFDTKGGTVTSGFNDGVVYMESATQKAVLTVNAGECAQIACFSNLVGAVEKRGAGTLSVGLTAKDASTANDVKVSDGVLELKPNDGETWTVTKATVAAGAILKIPAGASFVFSSGSIVAGATIEIGAGAAVTVADGVTIAAGAVFTGTGKLKIGQARVSEISGWKVASDMTVVVDRSSTELGLGGAVGEPAIVGTPAFWVDATRWATDMTLVSQDDREYITRWNDCRGTEGYNFATNVVNTHCPYLLKTGATGSKPCLCADRNAANDTGGLRWAEPIYGIRAVFVVQMIGVGPEGAGGLILGSTRRLDCFDFYREGIATYNNPLVDPTKAPDYVKNAPFFVNGQPWDYMDGWRTIGYTQLLECHPLAPGAKADAFNYNSKNSLLNGCQKTCEVLVYTNVLTMVERQRVADYLMQKWCGTRASVARAATVDDGGDLTLSCSFGYDLPAGADVLVPSVSGSGRLVKDGAGTLHVDLVNSKEAGLDVRNGSVVVRSAPTPTLAQLPTGHFAHFDAAQTNLMSFRTVTFDCKNADCPEQPHTIATTNEVNTWYDARLGKSGSVIARPRQTDPSFRGGWLVTNAVNGLPVLDYGPVRQYKNGLSQAHRAFHQFYQNSGQQNTESPAKLHEAFLVLGTAGGGGSLFGWNSTGLQRASEGTTDPSTAMLKPSAHPESAVQTRLNGVDVDGTKTGFTGGYDQVSLEMVIGNADLKGFGGISYANSWCGGQQLGEIVIYTNRLTFAEKRAVESYLNRKWFNRSVSYASPSVAGDVKVAVGATLTVEGGAPLTVTSLSGGGTVNGSLALADIGFLETEADGAGGVRPCAVPSVSGGLDLSAGGMVRVTGTTKRLKGGDYPLVSGVTAFDGLWAVTFDGFETEGCSIVCRAGTLYLRVPTRGLLMLVH